MSILADRPRRIAGGVTSPASRYEFVVLSQCLPVQQGKSGVFHDRCGAAATTLQPVVSARRGAWVGWIGEAGADCRPFVQDGVVLHPVALSQAEISEHLIGQCETTIGPLYHQAVVAPQFNRRWREAYRSVNQRFAEQAAGVAAPGGLVWVHDYHLQLVPAMLRQLRPDLLIGFYLHTPFPGAEMYRQMPMRVEILSGLLGADVIGFQTARAAANFRALTAEFLALSWVDDQATVDGRDVAIGVYPQSVPSDAIAEAARQPAMVAHAEQLRTGLGGPSRVLLAVDRLHPAKGIEQRLNAYAELLRDKAVDPATTVLIQVAAPEPLDTVHARDLRGRVERRIGQINGRYGQVGRPAVHYLHRSLARDELLSLYLAADVLLATPLCDGVSLAAKEYVMTRADDTGAVVLSEFTGTATELPQAFVVNPYDVDAIKRGVVAALSTPQTQLRQRMAGMRSHVRKHDVQFWAGSLVSALGRSVTLGSNR